MGSEVSRGPHPSSILAALDDQQLGALLREARRAHHDEGATLFREGAGSTSVMLVEAGRVKITCTTEDGREIVLAIRGPGDVLGELGALDERPRSATVTALDEVEVLVIPAGTFRALIERDGRLALEILGIVGDRLREADRKRVEFGAVDTPTRVALRLLELSSRYGAKGRRGTDIALALTQEELAGWVGSSREAVSKALRTFREEGWIETGRRQITILDEHGLRRYVRQER